MNNQSSAATTIKVKKNVIGKLIRQKVQDNPFWTVVKTESGIDIPLYLKHLLHCTGFDSPTAMKSLEASDFQDMENYAKYTLPVLLEDEEENLMDFFSMFYRHTRHFVIPRGHRLCILEFRDFVRNKGPLHFQKMWQTKKLNCTENPLQIIINPETDCDVINCQGNVVEEGKNLYKKLYEWYERQINGRETFKSFLEGPPEKFIKVYRTEKSHGNISFTAKVTCCLCDKIMAAHKELYGRKTGERTKTRWIFQNFLNHIKNKHFFNVSEVLPNDTDCNMPGVYLDSPSGSKRNIADCDSDDLNATMAIKREKTDECSPGSSEPEY